MKFGIYKDNDGDEFSITQKTETGAHAIFTVTTRAGQSHSVMIPPEAEEQTVQLIKDILLGAKCRCGLHIKKSGLTEREWVHDDDAWSCHGSEGFGAWPNDR